MSDTSRQMDTITKRDLITTLKTKVRQLHIKRSSTTAEDGNFCDTQGGHFISKSTQDQNGRNGFLEVLPREIRNKIYAQLLPGTVYHAELSEPIPHSKPILERFLYLLRTCKQTRNEVTFWYKRIEHLYNFTETAFFGPMDLNLAKFNLTVCSSDWEKYIPWPLIIDPYLAIRRLQIKLVEEEILMSMVTDRDPRFNTWVMWFANHLTHLEELDVVLTWPMPFCMFKVWLNWWDKDLVGQTIIIPFGIFCAKQWDDTLGITGNNLNSRPNITILYAGKEEKADEHGVVVPPKFHQLVSWSRGSSTPVISHVENWDAELDNPEYETNEDEANGISIFN